MISKLVILGGSTPFTAGLINALKAVGDRLPAQELVLHGRNRANLDLVGRYACQQLQERGWRIHTTSQMEEALAEATTVIHQIRYGGMERRAVCEEVCARFGVIADETLGPAALLCAMLSVPEIRSTCFALRC